MNNVLSVLKYTLPFANDIGNVATISGEGVFKRLYKPCPDDWDELGTKTLIDILALCGIVWNVGYVSQKYGYIKGIKYGCMLIIIAYMIPNLTMELFINTLCGDGIEFDDLYKDKGNKASSKCSSLHKLIVGSLYLLILFILEIILSNLIKGQLKNSISRIFTIE